MRLSLAALAVMIATVAWAKPEPWEGRWAAEPNQCARRHVPKSYIRLTKTVFDLALYNVRCTVTGWKATDDGHLVYLLCPGEMQSAAEEAELVFEDGKMTVDVLNVTLEKFRRCRRTADDRPAATRSNR